jgi:hypothetical protein
MLFKAITFGAAAFIHFGLLISGNEHQKAGIAESVIALVLLGGFALTWIRPRSTRAVGLTTQAFAPLGTLVGSSRSP